jgi:hypothetical protein
MERSATLQENFHNILVEFTAGDPMREGVLWTKFIQVRDQQAIGAEGHTGESARGAPTAQEEPSGPAQSLQEKTHGRAPGPHAMRSLKTSAGSKRCTASRARR